MVSSTSYPLNLQLAVALCPRTKCYVDLRDILNEKTSLAKPKYHAKTTLNIYDIFI